MHMFWKTAATEKVLKPAVNYILHEFRKYASSHLINLYWNDKKHIPWNIDIPKFLFECRLSIAKHVARGLGKRIKSSLFRVDDLSLLAGSVVAVDIVKKLNYIILWNSSSTNKISFDSIFWQPHIQDIEYTITILLPISADTAFAIVILLNILLRCWNCVELDNIMMELCI